jgi:hypothetical protein
MLEQGRDRSRKVAISLSDPWDLGESIGWRELSATLTLGPAPDDTAAIVVLAEALSVGTSEYKTFAVSPRHFGRSMSEVLAGDEVFASFRSSNQEAGSAAFPTLRFIGMVSPR